MRGACGQGQYMELFFGVINVSLYAWISFKSDLYGDAALNALYYFPMQFIGLWQWRKRGATDDVKAVRARRMTAGSGFCLLLPVPCLLRLQDTGLTGSVTLSLTRMRLQQCFR